MGLSLSLFPSLSFSLPLSVSSMHSISRPVSVLLRISTGTMKSLQLSLTRDYIPKKTKELALNLDGRCPSEHPWIMIARCALNIPWEITAPRHRKRSAHISFKPYSAE